MDDTSSVEKQDIKSAYSSEDTSTTDVSIQTPEAVTSLDIPANVLSRVDQEGLKVNSQGIVSFPESSPAHPRQWPVTRKLYDTGVIVLLEFFMTVVSNSGSNLSSQVSTEIGASLELTIFCLTTVYLLGQATGGLLFPPITETFGGKFIYVFSSAVYTAMCLVLGLAPPTIAGIVVARYVQGVLSAMPTVVATGSIENMWGSRDRVWVVSVWAVGGVLGLAIGPVYAVYVSASNMGWQVATPKTPHRVRILIVGREWVFNAAGVAMGMMTFLALEMRESRPGSVLRKKVAYVKALTEYEHLSAEGEAATPSLKEFARDSLSLPLWLFFTEPIVCLTSIMGATVISLIYLFAQALPIVYVDSFALSSQSGALVFLIIGAGVLFTFLPRCYDTHIANKRQRANQAIEPEDKLFGLVLSAPLLAIGLWWFAATVPPLVSTSFSPVVSMIPMLFVGFASVEFDYVLAGYLTDTYQSRAASANSPMAFLRALVSGIYPLVGKSMYDALHASSATFILAAVATIYGIIALVFRKYGKGIRQRSRFAAATWS